MSIRIEDLDQTDFSEVADLSSERMSPVMPGEILLEEFLKPLGITQYRLSKEIGVPQRRIGEIVAGTRAITVDTSLRLARFFGMNDGFWIGLQTDYETAKARHVLADVLSRIHRFEPAPHAGA